MKNVVTSMLFVAFLAFTSATTIQAQTVAYVNSEDILSEMPAYKQAKSDLEAYGKQLEKLLVQKREEMQKYYTKTMEDVQAGNLTPKQQQEAEAKLQQMQADLQKEASAADQQLLKKEQELTKPIHDTFNEAIKKVAKENSYGYIVDQKLLLYSIGGIDATEKVKTALGLSW